MAEKWKPSKRAEAAIEKLEAQQDGGELLDWKGKEHAAFCRYMVQAALADIVPAEKHADMAKALKELFAEDGSYFEQSNFKKKLVEYGTLAKGEKKGDDYE